MSLNLTEKNIKAFSLFVLLVPFLLPTILPAQTVDAVTKQAELELELSVINQEISGLNNTIDGLQKEGASLNRDLKLLSANIAKANLNIKGKKLQIEKLGDGIVEKSKTVKLLETRIELEKQSLAQLIRKTNELDQAGMIEVILSGESLSEFFLDLDAFDALRAGLKYSTDALKSARGENQSAQEVLEARQADEMDAKAELERNKRLVEINEKAKTALLSINKNNQKGYEKVLVDRKKRAAEIRAALFALRDTAAIPFGEALRYAQEASLTTGVRPAFLLAILTQESNLGKDVGSCFVGDLQTGDGSGKNTGTVFEQVMKAPRDTAPFKEITDRLGRDWKNTPVSCPPAAKYTGSRGFGGGMGPSQFIPSTWELFKDRVGRMLNISGNEVNPWNPKDAIMATAVYVSDLGAAKGGYTAERNAACRYYSGAACSGTRRPPNLFYGNSAMSLATKIQETMIDPLQNT